MPRRDHDEPAHDPTQSAAKSDGRGGGDRVIEGQVRGIDRQLSEKEADVLHFRVERYDQNGNRLRPVPVELRSWTGFQGSLNEGDQVRVFGRWKDGQLCCNRVNNLTTGASLGKRALHPLMVVALILFALFFVAVASFVVIGFVQASNPEVQFPWCEEGQSDPFKPLGC